MPVRVAEAQRAFHSGARFSMKAVRPSLMSSDESISMMASPVFFLMVASSSQSAVETSSTARPHGEGSVGGDLLGQLHGAGEGLARGSVTLLTRPSS